jgi:TatA/E family protein of Tat protein translocase
MQRRKGAKKNRSLEIGRGESKDGLTRIGFPSLQSERRSIIENSMGNLGFSEIAFIFVVALLLFGPKKLPELGRSIGKGLAEFRRASAELRGNLEHEIQSLEQDVHAAHNKSWDHEPSDHEPHG